jgi:multidrug resistance protein
LTLAGFRRSPAIAVAAVAAGTFIDIVAYSIAIPVLPDLGLRAGISATVVGLLFGSFGLTLLVISVPMGAISDRVGRKGPIVAGLMLIAGGSLLFGFARNVAALFAARLAQGAGDAVTWVVGFALIADFYGPEERGRVMGLVMLGAGLGFMLGPSLGGWLYEMGGVQLPFMFVCGLAIADALIFLLLATPARRSEGTAVSMLHVMRVPAIAVCAIAVIAPAATLAMLEPVLGLFFKQLGMRPAQIGLLFGIAAVASTITHPISGRLSDRWGGRTLLVIGLLSAACLLPVMSAAWNGLSSAVFIVLLTTALALTVTPSLTFIADAASAAHIESFGIVYGIYNCAWAIGLMAGPSLGGFLFDRLGFQRLALIWAPVLVALAWLLGRLGRVQSDRSARAAIRGAPMRT